MASCNALEKVIMESTLTNKKGQENLPVEKKDPLVEFAQKMLTTELKIKLKEYYVNDSIILKLIKKLKKGDNLDETCLLSLIVSYWKKNDISPQDN